MGKQKSVEIVDQEANRAPDPDCWNRAAFNK